MSIRRGFSLLELLVAIAIIGLLAATVIPNIRTSKPEEVREAFLGNLNKLMSFTWQNAVKTQKVHKVLFDFGKKEISVTQESPTDKNKYIPVKSAYTKTKIKMIDQLELKNFYLEGKDKAGIIMQSGRKAGEVDFYVTDGISQAIIINFLDNKDRAGKTKRPIGLVLNPFSAQFEVYDELKKP